MTINCPKDINFKNTFSQNECEMKRFYGDCWHCWNTAIAKHDEKIRIKTIDEVWETVLKHQTYQENYLSPPEVDTCLDLVDLHKLLCDIKGDTE